MPKKQDNDTWGSLLDEIKDEDYNNNEITSKWNEAKSAAERAKEARKDVRKSVVSLEKGSSELLEDIRKDVVKEIKNTKNKTKKSIEREGNKKESAKVKVAEEGADSFADVRERERETIEKVEEFTRGLIGGEQTSEKVDLSDKNEKNPSEEIEGNVTDKEERIKESIGICAETLDDEHSEMKDNIEELEKYFSKLGGKFNESVKGREEKVKNRVKNLKKMFNKVERGEMKQGDLVNKLGKLKYDENSLVEGYEELEEGKEKFVKEREKKIEGYRNLLEGAKDEKEGEISDSVADLLDEIREYEKDVIGDSEDGDENGEEPTKEDKRNLKRVLGLDGLGDRVLGARDSVALPEDFGIYKGSSDGFMVGSEEENPMFLADFEDDNGRYGDFAGAYSKGSVITGGVFGLGTLYKAEDVGAYVEKAKEIKDPESGFVIADSGVKRVELSNSDVEVYAAKDVKIEGSYDENSIKRIEEVKDEEKDIEYDSLGQAAEAYGLGARGGYRPEGKDFGKRDDVYEEAKESLEDFKELLDNNYQDTVEDQDNDYEDGGDDPVDDLDDEDIDDLFSDV